MLYRKKPVVIEAVQWTGNNIDEIGDFMGHSATMTLNDSFVIPTLEGDMYAAEGDWIIKGVKGEFYPCKPDIFKMTYESVEEMDEPDYDVVLDVLQKHHDKLFNMDKNTEVFGIMQQIRMEQCYELQKAMNMWKAATSWKTAKATGG